MGIFPVAGYGETFLEHIRSPVSAVADPRARPGADPDSQLRTSILETLHADYIRTARAKGLAEHTVITSHVLRNALIPR